MFKRPFTILIVPKDKSEVRSINVSLALLYFSLLVFGFWVGVMVFYVRGYYHRGYKEAELAKLKLEKEALLKRVELISAETDSLKQKMDLLVEQERRLRILADLPEINEDVRRVGIGGSSPAFPVEDRWVAPGIASLTQTVHLDVDQLLREAKLVQVSFREIETKLRRQKWILDHTPTIRPARGFISSGFGLRRDPFTGYIAFHRGVDIVNRVGTPIYAPADGVVKYYRYIRHYGNLLVINHGYGITTYYAHLQRSFVRPGERVKRGQKIALMGRTGRVTGPHLHYEVRINGTPVNPINYFYADEIF